MHALNATPVPNRGSISVESLVYISDFPVLTLFDSGASHSFIPSDLVESLHLSTSLVYDPMCVSNPIGGSAHLPVVCMDLKISILSIEFMCNV